MDPAPAALIFWTRFQAIWVFAQAVILGITVLYLRKYVRSTKEIADATRDQLTTAQEPVVSFEFHESRYGLRTHPTMVNHSRNHARCWLDLGIRVKGQPVAQGRAYEGTGSWTVQAGQTVNGYITTPGIRDEEEGEEAFLEMLDDQKADKTPYNELITATVTLRYRRLHADGPDKERIVGPLRYYFGVKERKWIPEFPEPS